MILLILQMNKQRHRRRSNLFDITELVSARARMETQAGRCQRTPS